MITLDGHQLTNNAATGIQRNTIEILKELDKIIEPNKFEIAIPSFSNIDFGFKNIGVVRLKAKPRTKIFRGRTFIFNNITYKRYIKKNHRLSIDMLLTFPRFGCDIIMVYDTIPELFPSHYIGFKTKLWYKSFLQKQRKSIKRAKLILTDSYSAEADIERIYPISKGKVQVVYCGWQHILRIGEDDNIFEKLNLKKGEYFFSLGSRLIHKNVKWIVSAAKQNPEETFVVTGRIAKVDDGGETLPNVIYTGYLSDEEIKSLMKHCKAFIQPSMYEGFGLPPMEAMGVGAQCIVSTGGSLPEIYEKSVWYIDPYKYDGIDLKKIMEPKIESIQKVLERFSWERSAKQLKDILDEFERKYNS